MYYILYSILYLFSLLPLRLIYVVSDFFYVLVYYLIGYRKKVVMQNLLIAFPEKTQKERTRIAKDFYHRFIDSMLETVKLLSAPDRFFEKRFTGNWELLDSFYNSGKAVQLHLGHTFNWEWGNIQLQKKIRYQVLGVYMPISNPAFDRLFQKLRRRSGTKLLSAHNMAKDFLPYRGTRYCLALIADQSPARMNNARWHNFFNRKTAFTTGPAKNAVKNDTIVIFAAINRPRRGYYQVTFSVAETRAAVASEQELTEKFVRYLEDVIRSNPPMWLWSHRRWKHEWKEGED